MVLPPCMRQRNFTMKYVFLLLSGIIISCSKAQPPEPIYQKILPGDPALDVGFLKPHKVKYKKKGAEMLYDMHTERFQDEERYELFVSFNRGEGEIPDKMYIDMQTLGFAGRRMSMPDYTLEVAMADDNAFTGNLEPTEGSSYSPILYDKDHPHGAFEPAVLNYFLAALPLKAGYTASIPCMDLNQGSQILWANIEVEGEEELTIDGKTYQTWKVVSDGIRKKTFWLSKEVPYFIKMKTKGTSGGPWILDEVLE